MAPHGLDDGAVRDAETENEPSARRFVQRLAARPHRNGVAGVDVRDAGRKDQLRSAGCEETDQREWIPPDRFRHPQCRVAPFLQASARLDGFVGIQTVERGPHAEPSEPVKSYHFDVLPLGEWAGGSKNVRLPARLVGQGVGGSNPIL
jgi:hypothetical protein